MKRFTWKFTICLVPLLISALIVGNAVRNYFNGKGGFKLGVDLVGGTILIYEVDVNKFPDGKLPADWKPQLLAARLKERIDPGDIYNIAIRVASNTRFEIILPTGGQHQIAALEKEWRKLLDEQVEKEYPVEKYIVPVGHTIELLADVNAQYPDEDVEKIRKFIEEHYKYKPTETATAEEEKAWKTLLDEVAKAYPPKKYEVGRGKVSELANQLILQHPDADIKEINKLLGTGHAEGKKGRRGVSLTTEQVQERKELIAQVGSLEFRMVANRENDSAALDSATAWFKDANSNPAKKALLERDAFLGKPPPPPPPPSGMEAFETPLGRFTYSWVELGSNYRHEHGFANPRDPKSGALIPPPPPKEDPKYKEWEKAHGQAWKAALRRPDCAQWERAAEFRQKGELMPYQDSLLYSREVKNPRLPEKDREKTIEYFLLTRDAEVGSKLVTGDQVASAAPGMDGSVHFRMKPAGAAQFHEFTSKNRKHLMAIVLDGYIESAATIQSAISSSGQITGNFTPDKVDATVKVLRSGALPATLKSEPVSENTMGPTLGADTIKWGAISVLSAFGAVLLFMVVYYRFAGFVACVALLANLLLTVAFMVAIDATFTLPGLAGLVLMLGMAVDANVLIYERIREERERNVGLAQAIRNGYDHAFPTIIDTHLSSIFTAIVLYVVGNDQLKGFGISLTVGLIISLFTSLYMTRVMFDYWLARGWLPKLGMLRLFARPNIDFMAIRYYWFTATVILTIIGAALFIYRLDRGGLNIDFVGGTAYAGELNKPVDIDELKKALEPAREAKGPDGKELMPDLSVEQIFLSDPKYTEGAKSKLFTVRTAQKDVKIVQDEINKVLGKEGAGLLKTINLARYEIMPGNKEVYLEFTEPGSHQPTFASRAQVSMLLRNQLENEAAKLETEAKNTENQDTTKKLEDEAAQFKIAAQQFSVEGLGKENEGRFQWMELRFVEPIKDTYRLNEILKNTQVAFERSPQPERLENFDSQLAQETQGRALYAILASWGAILLYLWFRFGNWTFGAAAVICLIHDLFFTLGFIAFAHYIAEGTPGLARALLIQDFKIDLPTVAALLTLVGYSVNDTIVVFDRIREIRGKNPALTPQMINDGVNQTLSRTVLAALSVWLVVFVLYILGGEGVHLFAFVMVIGVLVGTYSSIYIASPLLLMFGEGRTPAGAEQRDRAPQPAQTKA